jgi:hypothetical protein
MTARPVDHDACREVCFVIGRGDAILWADASDSAEALPDSRARWVAIWHHRGELDAIAHSHPVGPAAFSAEDESTMQAIDGALGRAVRHHVVAPRLTIARIGERSLVVTPEPWWAGLLRLASGMDKGD